MPASVSISILKRSAHRSFCIIFHGEKLLNDQNRKLPEAHGIPASWVLFQLPSLQLWSANQPLPQEAKCLWRHWCRGSQWDMTWEDSRVVGQEVPGQQLARTGSRDAAMVSWIQSCQQRKNWGCVRTRWDVFWAVVPGGCIWVQPNIPSS